jgi:hypothetical protein
MFETQMLLAAALMLVGAFVVTGAWLLTRRGPRTLVVVLGAGIFAAGVVALARAL